MKDQEEFNLPNQPEVSQRAAWKDIVTKYQQPAVGAALWQVVNTLVPYAALWYLMYLLLPISWWLVLPLGVLAGGLLVRVFIIFHDCGHGSFFKSRAANDFWGFLCGMLTFTPYYHWRWEHALHHATSGDLDRRGTGDLWTMTVQEYIESSRGKRFAYRLARNPVVLFVLAPLYVFMVRHRIPKATASRRERYSVYWMNLAILGMAAVMSAIFGFKAYLLLQLTALMVAGAAGFWLFTCSISSREFTGSAVTNGITRRRRCKAVRSTNFPACCNGFQATSDFIISTISAHGFPITTWKSVTGQIRCFRL